MSSEMKWKLVPVEPTDEMVKAGWKSMGFGIRMTCPAAWGAMLATAPEPPAPAGEVVACRHRYRYPDGRVSGWIHRRGLIQGHPASDRFAALEVEPLYTAPPTVSPDAVRRAALEEAAQEAWRAAQWVHCTPDDIAAAILALATQPAPDGRG